MIFLALRPTKHNRSAPRSLRLAAVLGLALIPPVSAVSGGGFSAASPGGALGNPLRGFGYA